MDVFIDFGRSTLSPGLRNTDIELTDGHKYLGIVIDDKLSFEGKQTNQRCVMYLSRDAGGREGDGILCCGDGARRSHRILRSDGRRRRHRGGVGRLEARGGVIRSLRRDPVNGWGMNESC